MSHLINGPISISFITKRLESYHDNISDGAHAFFLGQVRADSNNHIVVEQIDYEAYNEMAERQIDYEIEAVMTQFAVNSIEIYHSVGPVRVGQYSVLVIVRSGHRKAALNALEYTVERIKYHIPIWKLERFSDGSSQWVNEKAKQETHAKHQ